MLKERLLWTLRPLFWNRELLFWWQNEPASFRQPHFWVSLERLPSYHSVEITETQCGNFLQKLRQINEKTKELYCKSI